MAEYEPSSADLRRWLTLDSGQRLQLPAELRGDTATARAGRAAFYDMHRSGDKAREASRRLGANSREARRLRSQARNAQERMLAALGYTSEEVRARMGRRTKAGLDALALIRY